LSLAYENEYTCVQREEQHLYGQPTHAMMPAEYTCIQEGK